MNKLKAESAIAEYCYLSAVLEDTLFHLRHQQISCDIDLQYFGLTRPAIEIKDIKIRFGVRDYVLSFWVQLC